MTRAIQPRSIAFSQEIYRALLFLYPADYRREYGALMVQVFRDVCRDKYVAHGLAGISLWWCTTLLDLVFTVIEQRRKVRFAVSKSTFVQLTGIFLILGGICGALTAFSQLQPGSRYSYYGVYQLSILMVFPAFTLIALGITALALRFSDRLTLAGRLLLYLAALGAFVSVIGFAISQIADQLWMLVVIGMMAHAASLTAFSVQNLRANALPIPKLLVFTLPITPLALTLNAFNIGVNPGPNIPTFTLMLWYGLAWIITGILIQRATAQRSTTNLNDHPRLNMEHSS